MGRPTKFDPVKAQQICAVLSKGGYLQDACALVELEYRTVQRWIAQGEESAREPYHRFAKDVAHARAQHTMLALQDIQNGENWRAKAWVLGKLRPMQFGDRVRVQVTDELEGILDRLKDNLDPAAYAQVVAVLAGEAGSEAAFADPAGGSAKPSSD